MLSPRYLEGLSDEIVEIYAQLEADVLQDMARRIARLGKVTEATKWQAQLLAETGALKKDVNRLLKKYDPAIQKEIKAIYNDALIKNARADNRIFTEALGHGVSDINAQVMLASIKKTHSDLSRLTITTAYTTEQQFVQQANNAYMQVATGAVDYDSAMKNACNNLARDGITGVQYRNGQPVRLSIENAVRMNVITGVNQTASAMTMSNCEELGCDLVETTAHIGARPSHEEWQGQIFSISGSNKKYRPFSVCGLGEIDGICGINCRHSYYPYFEGLEKHYTQSDLDDMENVTVQYNGKTYSRYDAEEKLRYMERNVRKYKRQALTQEAGGVDNTAARVKIGEWQAAAREFTKQTGIERDHVREFIGTKDGKQPRALNPAIQGFNDNLKKAQEIKRFDNARNKVIANVKQGAPMNFRQADGGAPNPNYIKGGTYRTNCQTCVVAYELRRRGFGVEALNNFKGSMSEVLSYHTNLAWVDRTTGKAPDYILPNQYYRKDLYTWLKSNALKNENRYTIEFMWRDEQYGHIIHFWKNRAGDISFYDPQNGINTRGESMILKYIEDIKPTSVKLLDVQNCDINMNVVNKILTEANK